MGEKVTRCKLVSFEIQDWCYLTEVQVNEIKEELEKNINKINKYAEEGRKPLKDIYVNQQYGIRDILPIIGITAKFEWKEG